MDKISLKESKKTRWCVITGAPCSGKTSVISELQKKGFEAINEVSRDYFKKKQACGITMADLFENMEKVEADILNMRIEAEKKLDRDKLVFLDRGIVDSIAYCRRFKQKEDKAIEASRLNLYFKVFLMERLEFKEDGLRYEDDRTAEELELLLTSVYEEAGYTLIRIPVIPIRERATLILRYLDRS